MFSNTASQIYRHLTCVRNYGSHDIYHTLSHESTPPNPLKVRADGTNHTSAKKFGYNEKLPTFNSNCWRLRGWVMGEIILPTAGTKTD